MLHEIETENVSLTLKATLLWITELSLIVIGYKGRGSAGDGKSSHLTQCILVDSSTVICWIRPFVILGVSGLFCRLYSNLDGKLC